MNFVDICAFSDVPNGKHRAYALDGRSILVVRINTDVYVIENRCTHLDFPLDGGRQIGCEIICRAHGARFDVQTGRAVGSPAVDPVPCFESRVLDGRIEVRPRSE